MDQNKFAELKSHLKDPKSYTDPILTRTGVPPHVKTFVMIDQVRAELDKLTSYVRDDFFTMVEACVKAEIQSAGHQAGNVTQSWINDKFVEILAKLNNPDVPNRRTLGSSVSPLNQQHTDDTVWWTSFYHESDSTFKNVPPSFKLPGRGNNAELCWRLWWCGHRQNKINPYRLLRQTDFGLLAAADKSLTATNQNRRNV